MAPIHYAAKFAIWQPWSFSISRAEFIISQLRVHARHNPGSERARGRRRKKGVSDRRLGDSRSTAAAEASEVRLGKVREPQKAKVIILIMQRLSNPEGIVYSD